SAAPASTTLEQNYPNPFSDKTSLQFSIPSEQNISVKLYDALGRFVSTLLQGNFAAGTYTSEFGASGIPNGTYFVTLGTPVQKITKQIIIAR
ncbi:MAG TPA: T9SS type A sorting domain-containing protein, partial [Candidatus Kapabacteria bacterium]|nr:T9SS type A sorting domain-containing protein [Candidatus Kapabacteria bacterium]